MCSLFHIRGENENGSIDVIDLGVGGYQIDNVNQVKHSTNVSPVYGVSSLEFDEFKYLEAQNTHDQFNWIHNNSIDRWTIETWINLKEIKPDNPILLNAMAGNNIGFALGFDSNAKLNF